MIRQRQKHEVMVQVILPQEHLCLLRIGSETHIAGQTVAIDLHITSVSTLQGYAPQVTVNHLKLRQVALIARMGIIQQTVFQGNSRTVGSLVDDTDGLAIGNIL